MQWLAGYLEGEGTFAAPCRGSLLVQAKTVDRDTALRFAQQLNGHVSSPRNPNPAWSRIYVVAAQGPHLCDLIISLYNYLGRRRRLQARTSLEKFSARNEGRWGRSALHFHEAERIRRLATRGSTTQELATQFAVSPSVVSNILAGRSYTAGGPQAIHEDCVSRTRSFLKGVDAIAPGQGLEPRFRGPEPRVLAS